MKTHCTGTIKDHQTWHNKVFKSSSKFTDQKGQIVNKQ